MQYAQICDRVEADAAPGGFDLSAFVGSWVNSNPETNGIARLELSERGGRLYVAARAIGTDGLMDWEAVPADVFASGPLSRVGAGFTCGFDFGFARTRLQGMLAKGLLVLAQLHSFTDGSGRADYFVREYYALEHGRY
jgi:hypothetical protein